MERTISAEIISTGGELMLGRMVDTNSAWLSDFLMILGFPTVRHTAVGDDLQRLTEAFKRSWAESRLTVVTGGLGPTEDDLTRQAAAKAFGLELELHQPLADDLRELFQRRGYTMTDNNLRQAWLPRSSLPIPNPVGTAPGFALADPDRLMVFLPGVPHEMKVMAEGWLKPKLEERFPDVNSPRHTTILKTAGLGESSVDSLIGDLMGPERNPSIGLLAGRDTVSVLVTASGRNPDEARTLAAPVISELEKRLLGHVFGYGDDSLPSVLARMLKGRGLSLAILDAATQGRLNGRLAPALDRDNWSGGQDLPWQPALSGVTEILRLYAPDSAAAPGGDDPGPRRRRHGREIRLITTVRPDQEARPPAAPGQVALVLESAVQSEIIGGGQAVAREFHLGGEPAQVLSRAASLSMFHLWQVLGGFFK